jgi:hypothetical protein
MSSTSVPSGPSGQSKPAEEVKPKCSICLELLGKNDIIFTPCIHGFHNGCLKPWIDSKMGCRLIPCPNCKRDISEIVGPRDPTSLTEDDDGPDDGPLGNSLPIGAVMNFLSQLGRMSGRTPSVVPVMVDLRRRTEEKKESTPHPLDRVMRRLAHNRRRADRMPLLESTSVIHRSNPVTTERSTQSSTQPSIPSVIDSFSAPRHILVRQQRSGDEPLTQYILDSKHRSGHPDSL